MATRNAKRAAIVVAASVATLLVLAVVALYVAQREVKARVVQALGPLGTAQRIHVGLTAVTLHGVLLKGPAHWPAPYALRADVVTLKPDLRALLARRVHMRDIVVRGFDLPVVRATGGRLRLLPTLREPLGETPSTIAGANDHGAPPRAKDIDHVSFSSGVFDFYDETVSHPPCRITIGDAHASVGPLHLPGLAGPARIEAGGTIAGPQHTGTIAFSGWITIASKDSQTTTQLRGVDVATLDPYLPKKAGRHAQVQSGTVDLTVTSTVRDYQLHAPGVVTLHNLQLAGHAGPVNTFLSLPTEAAIAALKRHNGDITLHFELDGNLHDPEFSLNERLLTKIGAGLANTPGVSVEGVAGNVNDTVKGVGNALKHMLGQ